MKTKIILSLLSTLLVMAFVSHTSLAQEKPCCGDLQKKDLKKEVTPNQMTCPVMGGKVNKDMYVDYQGKRIYFCCAGCIETFKKDSEKYMEKMKEQGVVLEDTPIEQKTCPVSGEPINKEIFADYQGKRIYFGCVSCKETFLKSPEKYLKEM